MGEGVAELAQEVQQSWHWNSKRAGFAQGGHWLQGHRIHIWWLCPTGGDESRLI